MMKKKINFSIQTIIVLMLPFLIASCEEDPIENAETPVVDLGNDIIARQSEVIPLTASLTKADAETITFDWEILIQPTGSAGSIAAGMNNTSSLTPGHPGLYSVAVTATNAEGVSGSDTIDIKIIGVLPRYISENTTLADLFSEHDIPDYVIENNQGLTINSGLTIDPGVIIEVDDGLQINISGGAGAFLKALGTENNNIIFRGTNKLKGAWKSIAVESPSTSNQFNYVQIWHTGSTDTRDYKTGIYVKGNEDSRISFTNSTIAESDGYGFVMTSGGRVDNFSNNHFENNTLAPVRMTGSAIYKIDGSSTYTGNGEQFIALASNLNNITFSENGTISAPGSDIPYHVLNNNVEFQANTTISEGVKLLMSDNSRIWIKSEGSLALSGSASDPVTIDGIAGIKGSWRGIYVDSPSTANVFDHAMISNGGSSSLISSDNIANIALEGFTNARLTLTNSTVSNSDGAGIIVQSGATLTESDNTFSSNDDGDIDDQN